MIGSAIDTGFKAINGVSARALAAVPTYGKISSAMFVLTLLGETYVRCSSQTIYKLRVMGRKVASVSHMGMILSFKKIQMSSCIRASGYSWKYTIPAQFGLMVLPDQIEPPKITRTVKVQQGHFKDIQGDVKSDRPLLNAYLACGKEFLNVASKVIHSVATGVVVQKMWSGQTQGKIRVVVTTALLALSAWNIYNVETATDHANT